jgi:hypothetical protein
MIDWAALWGHHCMCYRYAIHYLRFSTMFTLFLTTFHPKVEFLGPSVIIAILKSTPLSYNFSFSIPSLSPY